jgi:hypothetical protein
MGLQQADKLIEWAVGVANSQHDRKATLPAFGWRGTLENFISSKVSLTNFAIPTSKAPESRKRIDPKREDDTTR